MSIEPDTEEIFKKKARIRSNLKGQLTRSSNFIENFEEISDVRIIESRYLSFKSLFIKFDVVQTEIEELVAHSDKESADQINERIRFEETFYEVEEKYLKLLNELKETRDQKDHLSNSQNTIKDNSGRIRLPTIELPRFDGKLTEYRAFIDLFDSIVDGNNDLNLVDKFMYLRAALKGEALRLIESLPISSANYDQARKLLQDRYDNKSCIKQAHLRAIFELQPADGRSIKSLRNLIDTVNKHSVALKAMGEEVEKWDTILIYLVSSKLDSETRRQFENAFNQEEEPNFDQLKLFISRKCAAMERLVPEERNVKNSTNKPKCFRVETKASCVLCKSKHPLHECPAFLQLDSRARFEKVKNFRLCLKCFSDKHRVKECDSAKCSQCDREHHCLLHFELDKSPKKVIDVDASPPISLKMSDKISSSVLLHSVVVRLRGSDGHAIYARGILDSGSQVNFISTKLLRKLGVNGEAVTKTISGIGDKSCQIRNFVELNVESIREQFSFSIKAYVLDKISSNLPQSDIEVFESQELPKGVVLADEKFYRSGPIDILFSNAVFVHILKKGVRIFDKEVKLINTRLGWVVGGRVSNSTEVNCDASFFVDTSENENFDFQKFWELEEIPQAPVIVDRVEQEFVRTYCRDGKGRFVVDLPFKENQKFDFGYSKSFALNRFYWLEKRLMKDSKLKESYDNFLKDYLKENFIEKVPTHNLEKIDAYYLPHHCVINETSLTTKLRVVFSGKDTAKNCKSINSLLETGPKLQNDLVSNLLKFRTHVVVFAADIEKMYSQIKISEKHRDFLRFFYRFDNNLQVNTFRLFSLPFGLNCSPYIAIRCLKELGNLNSSRYPIASRILLEDTYMDDILSGSNDLESAKKLCIELIEICSDGGFHLRKWKSNRPELLTGLCDSSENHEKEFHIGEIESKVLGMIWNSKIDSLLFSIGQSFVNDCTKRNILSWIARIFDPLGLISPLIITAKILIQRIWVLGIGWDEKVPLEIETVWLRLSKEMSLLSDISLKRFISLSSSSELFAFCDASEKAYGCCAYLKTENGLRLIYAKTRVAPIKIITLARLELCAAVICSRMVKYLSKCFDIDSNRIWLFSDSKIVLAWISKPPYCWKTFVANRVSEIQSNVPGGRWFHIGSSNNPADFASRGLCPKDLLNCSLWWEGPPDYIKLITSDALEKTSKDIESCLVKLNCRTENSCTLDESIAYSLLSRISNFNKLVRVYAQVLRFVKHESRFALSLNQIENALNAIIREVQLRHFKETIERLRKGKSLEGKGSLSCLQPFLDSNSVLRVGGRLENSNLSFEQKHPIILPKRDVFTDLLIRHEHLRQNHSGLSSLLGSIRQKFWVINARATIRKVLRRCIRCFRYRPIISNQLMGNLPVERTLATRAFVNVGVDLCGPFLVRPTKKRGNQTVKRYVALFVCFGTKALHLETVSELTSESFLAAFRRFTGRRGLPKVVMSDNGTNFVGLSNLLKEWYDLLSCTRFQNDLNRHLLSERIEWRFIPPRTPNFGGLWESHIKLFKALFVKCVGESRLTFEEFDTILIQIEASLNSRPLVEVSDSPNDLEVLTPGHFLTGSQLNMLPCPYSHEFPGTLTARWKHLQQLFNSFWTRWSKEYLSGLQVRRKNAIIRSNVKVGDIGLIVENEISPLKWPLGLVIRTIAGKDNLVRVLEIKTQRGIFKRGISKFCALPDFEHTRNVREYGSDMN